MLTILTIAFAVQLAWALMILLAAFTAFRAEGDSILHSAIGALMLLMFWPFPMVDAVNEHLNRRRNMKAFRDSLERRNED